MDDAIQVLVTRKAIYRKYLVGRGFSSADADDLFQEAAERFLRVQKNQVIKKPQGYFGHMLVNAARDLVRRRRRLVVIFDSDMVGNLPEQLAEDSDFSEPESLSTAPQDADSLKNIQKRILMRLSHMPRKLERYRRILEMHYLEKISREAIAARLGIELSSYYVHLGRARKAAKRYCAE